MNKKPVANMQPVLNLETISLSFVSLNYDALSGVLPLPRAQTPSYSCGSRQLSDGLTAGVGLCNSRDYQNSQKWRSIIDASPVVIALATTAIAIELIVLIKRLPRQKND
jgi:hypothetical protein